MSALAVPVTDKDHREGPDTAPVTLVQYGDYECPYCEAAYPVIKQIQREYGPALRFVFRNFPLVQLHQYAALAAEAAESAGLQGEDKFWEYHDGLYMNQKELGPELVIALAQQLGLDMPKFETDLTTHKTEPRVAFDANGGVASGVKQTPTFFINGAKFDGVWENGGLEAAVKAAMDASA